MVTVAPRGYIYPFLETLRETGIARVRLVLARPADVAGTAQKASASRALTVVEFAVAPVLGTPGAIRILQTTRVPVAILGPVYPRDFFD